LGRAEPFNVRPPEHGLRKALLLDQHLPVSTPASLGTREIEPIEQFPDPAYLASEADPAQPEPPWLDRAGNEPMVLTLADALMIAARNSRDYQSHQEQVCLAALALDLERDDFRTSWAAFLESGGIAELLGEDTYVVENRAGL